MLSLGQARSFELRVNETAGSQKAQPTMKIITAENIENTATLAYNAAVHELLTIVCGQRGLPTDAPLSLPLPEAIGELKDKGCDKLVSYVRDGVRNGGWGIVNAEAWSAFATAYKTALPLTQRRILIAQWLGHEGGSIELLAVTRPNTATPTPVTEQPAEKPKRTRKPRAAKPATVADVVTTDIANGAAPALATSTTIRELAAAEQPTEQPKKRSSRQRQAMPVITEQPQPQPQPQPVVTVVAAPAIAPQPKPAKPVTVRQPRDRYDGMNLQQLLAEVQRMFGKATNMTNENALRYKLRRGEKQIAAGQPARFSVSTPSKPRVWLSIEHAADVVRYLAVFVKQKGDAKADAIIGAINEQLQPATPSTVAA